MIIDQANFSNFYLLRCSGGDTCESVLTELSEYVIDKNLATKDHTKAILEREAVYPTGIQACTGIAIPHTDSEYTKNAAVVVAILDKPSKFKTMGGSGEVDVEIVFMLLVDKPENQVKVLGTLVDLIQNENDINKLKSKGDEALKLLSEKFSNLL